MKKDDIRRQAYRRMAQIEDRHPEYVPGWSRAYWLLNYLIVESFSSYFAAYGLMPIKERDAQDGREDLGLGPLSQFERDCINLLSQRIEAEELRERERRRHGVPSPKLI